MPAPTTALRFNSTTPAPPTGQQNVTFQSDGGTPQQQITAYDPVMVGDTGFGGTTGNVPAPAAGDAAAAKFLKADGTWTAPPTASGNATEIQSVDVSATAPTTGQVLTYDGTEWAPATPSGGGGGLSGMPITMTNAQTSTNTGWQDYSVIAKIGGAALWGSPTSWKVRMQFTAGSPVIGGMVILRTAAGSTTVIDSTTVTVGGNTAPTLSSPGVVVTDAISLALDTSHDYYFVLYFTTNAANSSVVVVANGQNNLPTGIVNGNALTDTTIPSLITTNSPYLITGAFNA